MSPIQNLRQANTVKKTDAAASGAQAVNTKSPNGGFAQILAESEGRGVMSEGALPQGQMGLEPNLLQQLDLEMIQLENNLEAEELAMNSQLGVNPQAVEAQIIETLPLQTEPTPKFINTELIKQVQEVVAPGQIHQVQVDPTVKPMTLKDLLLQQQQQAQQPPVAVTASVGRAPATSFEQGEFDPKLMQFEDFVAQKNAVTAKNVNAQVYGVMNKNPLQVEELAKNSDWSLENALPESLSGVTSDYVAPQPVYTMEAPLPASSLKAEMAPAAKVFDLNQMNNNQDVDSVISQVTDYIVQAKSAKEPTVTMKMQHQDLGLLDITVSRSGQHNVNVILGAQDANTKMFLGQHREQLMTHLTQAGVGVSDLRFEQSAPSKDFNSQSGHQQQHSGERQYGSQQNERNAEQERRQQLWELLREKEVA
jgi:hypothetical protein